MLGLAPLPRSLEAALRDARDPKAAVRRSAVGDLGRHAATADAARAVTELTRVLAADVSAEVRGAAAIALADAKAHDAVGALVAAVDDTHQHVRQMAVIALGEVGAEGDLAAVKAVEKALRDDAAALRYQALIASARLEIPKVEEALLEGTGDDDAEVRHVSFRLLEERATTDEIHVRPSDAILATARASLGDPVLRVRLAAAVLLGRAGERSGAPVLVEAVGHSQADMDPEDEQTAIVLAGELGVEAAIPALERRAWGLFGLGRRRFAYEAQIALAQLGNARARATILRGLSGWTRDTRTLSVVAAGRARLSEARATILDMQRDETRAEPNAVKDALDALERQALPAHDRS